LRPAAAVVSWRGAQSEGCSRSHYCTSTGRARSSSIERAVVFYRTAEDRSGAWRRTHRPILRSTAAVTSYNLGRRLRACRAVSYRGHSKILRRSATRWPSDQYLQARRHGIGPTKASCRGRRDGAGPTCSDQRHRALIKFTIDAVHITPATSRSSQVASVQATPVDNNGDGANNDRPVVNGVVIGNHRFGGTRRRYVGVRRALNSTRGRSAPAGRVQPVHHANCSARATIYGDTTTVNKLSGQVVARTAATAPALANIDRPVLPVQCGSAFRAGTRSPKTRRTRREQHLRFLREPWSFVSSWSRSRLDIGDGTRTGD